jgi:hypothetical protein
MNTINDVREIRDIPKIENYLDKVFKLALYEVGDRIEIYNLDIGDNMHISIDLHSDETVIDGEIELVDLITRENIHYLSYAVILNETDILKQYSYRPLVPSDEKTFIN